LKLSGQVHNSSSAALASQLLGTRGYSQAICQHVSEAIAEHLGPGKYASVESQCLYDADLIDANIGLPAFVRNIYIHQHFYDLRRTTDQPPMALLLRENPRIYLEPYVRETLIRWIDGKARDFPPQLRTSAGRTLAMVRLDRVRAFAECLVLELDGWEHNISHGSLALVLHLMCCGDDPCISDEIAFLSDGWGNEMDLTGQTRQFILDLASETSGAI
jgi:hypothetical protein